MQDLCTHASGLQAVLSAYADHVCVQSKLTCISVFHGGPFCQAATDTVSLSALAR